MREETNELDIKDILLGIRKRIGTLFFIIGVTLFVTVLILYFTKPIYHSSVIINLDKQDNGKLQKVLPGGLYVEKSDQSQLELAKVTIRSPEFLQTILNKVNLDKEFFIKKNFKKQQVEEFPDIDIDINYKNSLLYGTLFDIIPINKDEFILEFKNKKIGIEYSKTHKYNEKIENNLFTLVVTKKANQSPFTNALENKLLKITDTKLIKPKYSFRLFDKQHQIDTIIDNLSFTPIDELGNILEIGYKDTMATRTKKVIEEIAKSYIEYNLANNKNELEYTLKFLNKQISDLKKDLKNSGDSLKKYQQKSGKVVMSEGKEILTNLEKDNTLIDKISLQLEAIESFKRILKREGTISSVSLINSGINISSIQLLINDYRKYTQELRDLELQQKNINKPITTNLELNKLINELKNKKLSLENLLANFTEDHPQVREEKEIIDTLKNQIYSTITLKMQQAKHSINITKSTILENINMTKSSLKNKLTLLKKDVKVKKLLLESIPEKHMINNSLKRNFALNSKTYSFLLQKKIDIEISKASTIANTKILRKAYLPQQPIYPKKTVVLVIGFVIGVILGLFYIFIKTLLDTKIRAIKDIKQLTNIPIYGVLPLSTNSMFFKESLRAIRTNLQFNIPKDKKSITILISSTVAGEGKTTTTAGLAKIIALADKKVLAIDLDLRKPQLHQELKQHNRLGITNYLTGDLKIENVIQPIDDNLDFLSAGSISSNPSELLMSNKFDKMMNELKERYEYIICDSAPIGLVVDTSIILKYSDILLFIVSIHKSEKNYIEHLNELVKNKNIKSSGIILNRIKKEEQSGYGYGYGYGYGSKIEKK